MSGYVGSEEQRALQKRAEEGYAWVMSTPGACNVARAIGSDDPDRLGLDTIQDMLLKDGLFGFRLLTFPRLEQLRTELAAIHARIDTWDVYDGAADKLGEAVATILEAGPPEGFSDMPALDCVGGTRTRLFQEFLFSGWMYAASPGLHAVEHPVYDIWLTNCKLASKVPPPEDYDGPPIQGLVAEGEDPLAGPDDGVDTGPGVPRPKPFRG